ncbi:MAG: hypothetical protein WB586_29175 [Chthoniobacterales bacterium]
MPSFQQILSRPPTIITPAGPTTCKKFFEFFTARSATLTPGAAYYRAIQQLLAWVERAGYEDIGDIEPITIPVAAGKTGKLSRLDGKEPGRHRI